MKPVIPLLSALVCAQAQHINLCVSSLFEDSKELFQISSVESLPVDVYIRQSNDLSGDWINPSYVHWATGTNPDGTNSNVLVFRAPFVFRAGSTMSAVVSVYHGDSPLGKETKYFWKVEESPLTILPDFQTAPADLVGRTITSGGNLKFTFSEATRGYYSANFSSVAGSSLPITVPFVYSYENKGAGMASIVMTSGPEKRYFSLRFDAEDDFSALTTYFNGGVASTGAAQYDFTDAVEPTDVLWLPALEGKTLSLTGSGEPTSDNDTRLYSMELEFLENDVCRFYSPTREGVIIEQEYRAYNLGHELHYLAFEATEEEPAISMYIIYNETAPASGAVTIQTAGAFDPYYYNVVNSDFTE